MSKIKLTHSAAKAMARLWLLITSVLMCLPLAAQGEMTSDSYQIYADSLGFNGGVVGTSTTYVLSSTAGESTAGTVSSTSYQLRGGFQASELDNAVGIHVLTTSLDLGTLSLSAVKSASTQIVVSSNSITGYTLTIGSISGTMPAAVSDGTVTAASEEYGVSASGDNAATTGDVSVIAGRVLASGSTPTASATTTITFKASHSTVSTPGSYNQTVTFTASANF